MRADKERAFELRRKGKSYKEIRKELGVPLATLSGWFSKEDWSNSIKNIRTAGARKVSAMRILNLNTLRRERLPAVYEQARHEAVAEFGRLSENPLFMTGVALYLSGGDKGNRSVLRLSSSNPEVIRLFVVFLRHICGVEDPKIRLSVHIYEGLDEPSTRKFWAFATGIPLANFRKSVVIASRHTKPGVRYGICAVSVSSTYLKTKMGEWLKLTGRELLEKRYHENIAPKAAIV